MSIDDKIFYNEASATKLGWAPEWFDCAKHGEKLVAAVAEFQKEHHLTADGCCGPATYRRLYNDRVANWDDHAPMAHKNNSESFIIYVPAGICQTKSPVVREIAEIFPKKPLLV